MSCSSQRAARPRTLALAAIGAVTLVLAACGDIKRATGDSATKEDPPPASDATPTPAPATPTATPTASATPVATPTATPGFGASGVVPEGTAVAPSAVVTVTFPEAIDPATSGPGIRVRRVVDDIVLPGTSGTTGTMWTFTPQRPFGFGQTYQIEIDATVKTVSGTTVTDTTKHLFTVRDAVWADAASFDPATPATRTLLGAVSLVAGREDEMLALVRPASPPIVAYERNASGVVTSTTLGTGPTSSYAAVRFRPTPERYFVYTNANDLIATALPPPTVDVPLITSYTTGWAFAGPGRTGDDASLLAWDANAGGNHRLVEARVTSGVIGAPVEVFHVAANGGGAFSPSFDALEDGRAAFGWVQLVGSDYRGFVRRRAADGTWTDVTPTGMELFSAPSLLTVNNFAVRMHDNGTILAAWGNTTGTQLDVGIASYFTSWTTPVTRSFATTGRGTIALGVGGHAVFANLEGSALAATIFDGKDWSVMRGLHSGPNFTNSILNAGMDANSNAAVAWGETDGGTQSIHLASFNPSTLSQAATKQEEIVATYAGTLWVHGIQVTPNGVTRCLYTVDGATKALFLREMK